MKTAVSFESRDSPSASPVKTKLFRAPRRDLKTYGRSATMAKKTIATSIPAVRESVKRSGSTRTSIPAQKAILQLPDIFLTTAYVMGASSDAITICGNRPPSWLTPTPTLAPITWVLPKTSKLSAMSIFASGGCS